MFGRPQVVEITVENSLVHRRWLGLSTTTIEFKEMKKRMT
jgi:hypothetical protein